jgi:hypothetical protein
MADGAGGHCFTVRFDGTSSVEADTGRGRTTAERIYEIRRRYLLKVENSCAHQLTRCRLLLMSAVDADGKEHIRTPLATCEPFSLSPGEPATVPVIAIIFDNFEKPIRFDPVSEAFPGTISLPPNNYTLSLRMLSDDSAPFSFRLAVESVGSTWIVRQIEDDHDDKNSEHARSGYAAGSFVSPNAMHGAGMSFAAGNFGTPAASLTLSPTTPDIEAIIPPQASGGSHFKLDESGRIDLVPNPPANADERHRELYDELRRKTFDLSALNPNLLGDLSAPINVFLGALPENIEAVSITRLWSRGNTLRRRLGAHELAVGSDEPDPARLPPLVAGQLHDLVDTLNVFIAAEPKGRELDEDRRGPQERDADRAIVNAFKPIGQALRAAPDVATPAAVEALTEQNEAAQDALSASGVDSDQAVALAGKSDINASIGLLSSGAAWLGRGAADDVKSGFYRGIGNTAAKAAIGGGAVGGVAVAVFIAHQATALKGFVDVAFHDSGLGRIIDAIAQAVSSMPPI